MQISWTNERRDATFCANEIFNFSPIALHRRYQVPLRFFPEISFSVSDRRPTLLFVKFKLAVTNIFIGLTAKKKEKRECFQKNGRDTYEHFFTIVLLVYSLDRYKCELYKSELIF